jgi:hypothetical protein
MMEATRGVKKTAPTTSLTQIAGVATSLLMEAVNGIKLTGPKVGQMLKVTAGTATLMETQAGLTHLETEATTT